MIRFKDREEAGRKLAHLLKPYKNRQDTIILGLARGGVVTAVALASELKLSCDVEVVRKIGAPDNEELAIGAITEHGIQVFNEVLIKQVGIASSYIDTTIVREREECVRREKLYRAHKPAIDIVGKTIILVDDGIATGLTMEAAIKDVRKRGAHKVVVAVPVMPADVVASMKKLCDELVYLIAPEHFFAIGAFYTDFTQVNHDKVIKLLTQ
ncbi:MAG: phosphoribosyltransferase family protein [Candidatus Babeliales bacterium]